MSRTPASAPQALHRQGGDIELGLGCCSYLDIDPASPSPREPGRGESGLGAIPVPNNCAQTRQEHLAMLQETLRVRREKAEALKEAAAAIPLQDKPEHAKYYRMLRLGLPVGAVKNAMRRDGADSDGSKYFKMRRIGLPISTVKKVMERDGVDPSILDRGTGGSLKDKKDTSPPLKEDPDFLKYFKMLRVGLPRGAVFNALQRDGKDPAVLDLDPNRPLISQTATNRKDYKRSTPKKVLVYAKPNYWYGDDYLNCTEMERSCQIDPSRSHQRSKNEEAGPPLKEVPAYAKYYKMISVGLPLIAVKHAMLRDGFDPAIMDLNPEKSLKSQTKRADDGPRREMRTKRWDYRKDERVSAPMAAAAARKKSRANPDGPPAGVVAAAAAAARKKSQANPDGPPAGGIAAAAAAAVRKRERERERSAARRAAVMAAATALDARLRPRVAAAAAAAARRRNRGRVAEMAASAARGEQARSGEASEWGRVAAMAASAARERQEENGEASGISGGGTSAHGTHSVGMDGVVGGGVDFVVVALDDSDTGNAGETTPQFAHSVSSFCEWSVLENEDWSVIEST